MIGASVNAGGPSGASPGIAKNPARPGLIAFTVLISNIFLLQLGQDPFFKIV
jgi:hypothetical protein